jgi:signal transduction histidine kinase
VAGGDLSICAPHSRAREIADVGEALIGMSQALGEAHEREREAERERRFLTTAIAHDLRTPLFTLRGYLEALQRGLPPRDYLNKATEKAALLESLLGDLFVYSQTEYTGIPPQKEPTDFGLLLIDVLGGFEQRAAAKEIQLTLSGPAEPVLVPIDRHLITRALNNLLDNALRHTPPGGEVGVHWQPRNGQIEFEIRDNGEGIAAEHLPHVFEPLYKVDTSHSRSTSSAGLGLAIARRLIEAHGGTLSADNITGEGAVLRGTLPQSANAEAVHSAAEDS